MEPERTVNSFLSPIVDDLESLEKGTLLLHPNFLAFRARLLCITADLPALRKLLSFCGHSGKTGCSKCKKRGNPIRSEKGKVKYVWDDLKTGKPRKHVEARSAAQAYKEVENQNQDRVHLKKRFFRDNPLYRLHYYDPIRMHVVDSMHNLFLGIVKTHLEEIFQSYPNDLVEMEKKIDEVKKYLTGEHGRTPENITQRLSSAKAAEVKNFAFFYSEYVFEGILSDRDYDCWNSLLLFLQLICAPSVSSESLDNAKAILKSYLTKYKNCYSNQSMSINFHMASHLTDSCKDFGPLHVFWCFAFERLTGDLQKLKLSPINIEIQIVNRISLEFFIGSTLNKYKDGQQPEILIPESILRFLDGRIEERERKKGLPISKPRSHPCPSPLTPLTGAESFEAEFIGSCEQATLSEYLPQIRLVTGENVANCFLLYSRFRLENTILHGYSWKQSNKCNIAFSTVEAGHVIQLIGRVEFFFKPVSSPKEFRLALVSVWQRGSRYWNFEMVKPDFRQTKMVIPIGRIEEQVSLIPKGSELMVIRMGDH